MEDAKDPGEYDKIIQIKGSSFDQSKGEKRHTRKVPEYEMFLGVKENIWMLLFQAVEELYPSFEYERNRSY